MGDGVSAGYGAMRLQGVRRHHGFLNGSVDDLLGQIVVEDVCRRTDVENVMPTRESNLTESATAEEPVRVLVMDS
jgi:hypothetical protein